MKIQDKTVAHLYFVGQNISVCGKRRVGDGEIVPSGFREKCQECLVKQESIHHFCLNP